MSGEKKLRTFRERLQFVLDETDLSHVDLAEIAGVTKQNVTEWISGRTKSGKAEALFAIEDKLSYAARWLATGDGPTKVKKPDPTDTLILSSVEKLSPSGKSAVQAFAEFQVAQHSAGAEQEAQRETAT